MADAKKVGFIVACKMYFGTLPEHDLSDFKNEVGKLTPKDREELIPGLEKELGVSIVRSPSA